MRTTIILVAVAVIVVAVLAACRARNDTVADSAAGDNARTDESHSDSIAAAGDSTPTSTSTRPASASRDSRAATPPIQRADDSARSSKLPPEDSIRAMRPKLPQVTPEKRPRAWRGFKLPEERPVRIPVETIRRVEPVPDSTMKGDSTKPPRPNR
jgi:hypothetical protein